MIKYYRYHRNNDHTTNECKALQDRIKELVSIGHFRRFVCRDIPPHPSRSDNRHPLCNTRHDHRTNQQTRQEPQIARTYVNTADPPLCSAINTIVGGFVGGGSTSSTRKKHFRHLQSINHITHSHHRCCMPPMTFTDDDFHGIDHQQDDPMVITVELENYAVKKVLIDQGSSIDILYWTTYQKLQLPPTTMVLYDELIFRFSGEKVLTYGYIDLHTVFREASQTKTIPIRFLVVDAPTSYNVLLCRPSLNILGAVVSTTHLAMKFPSPS
ncbi:uncharacterized protein LOC114187793 [Vigna unguiculata]|uniref:uncharacterized protein LOC114187793 n=1 Tax=Vigna unguiculata TaxID=3917 RepID=UPI001015F406|nr:uncharacterized protein LOC114187793 [Vigna unguiculata]